MQSFVVRDSESLYHAQYNNNNNYNKIIIIIHLFKVGYKEIVEKLIQAN